MERMILTGENEVAIAAAAVMAKQIIANPRSVLGLATGSTPIGMYGQLVDMVKKGELDFSAIRTFNLDEYYPMAKDHPQSYRSFMWEHLFSHINIKEENVHMLDGECQDPDAECATYERMIDEAGGIDLQLLGIGVEGHIAFNEASDALRVHTHLTDLMPSTLEANARFFDQAKDVPVQALTMGIGSIMQAKSILLIITGAQKAAAVSRLFSPVISTEFPASVLHLHREVTVILDEAAASLL